MPKYLTSSTLWYSGIFAAAATFDASIKIQRREKWDQAIAEVKLELDGPRDRERRELFLARQEVRRDTQEVVLEPSTPLDALGSEDTFRDVDPRAPKARWPSNTGPPLIQKHLPPQSIYASDESKEHASKRRWSRKKLALVHVSIDKLQLKLFLELQRRGLTLEAAKAVPEEYAREMLRGRADLGRLLAMKSETLRRLNKAEYDLSDYEFVETDYSLSSYRQDDLGSFHREAADLNASLLRLFRLQAEGNITKSALLAKVAYNLSISPAPPNVNTYNTLLLGLSRTQESSVFHYIVRSMDETHMRTNEVSLVAILNHYTKTNQPKKYLYWIGLIRGKDGGLNTASPDITITDAGRSRLILQPGPPKKIIQLPYPTPMVFAAIIGGVVKFSGFETALKICQNMREAGWGICMGGLTPLLRDCAERRDWASGVAVWRQIQALKTQSRRMYDGRWISDIIGLQTFGAMLTLCSRCNMKGYFQDVWSSAETMHWDKTEQLIQAVKGQSGDDIDHLMRIEETSARSGDFGVDLDDAGDLMAKCSDDVGASVGTDRDDDKPELCHPKESRDAGKVLNDLQRRPDEIRNQDERQSDRGRATDVRASPSLRLLELAASQSNQPLRRPRNRVAQPPIMREEQLWGVVPSGPELDDYELRERPVTTNR